MQQGLTPLCADREDESVPFSYRYESYFLGGFVDYYFDLMATTFFALDLKERIAPNEI